MDKTEIRNKFIELRSDLSPNDIQAKTVSIVGAIETSIDWRTVRQVHVYRSVHSWNEVPTNGVVQLIQSSWPDISITIGNPDRSSKMPEGTLDVIFVPLLAFDAKLNRLGFGGGWYDRFLASQPEALKVGLAFDIQQCDSFPIESHDIAMDCIITESRVITR